MEILLAHLAVLGSLALPSARASPVDDEAAANAVDVEEHEEKNDDVTAGAEIDSSSRFVWRGLALSDGPVVQPSAWASAFGATAAVWTNVMLTEERPRGSIVPSLCWDFDWRSLTLTPGALVYAATRSDDASPTTAEASLDVALRLGELRIMSGHRIDVVDHVGAYFGTVGVAWRRTVDEWTLGARVDVAFANAAFHRAYVGVSETGASSFAAEFSVRRFVTPVAYVALHAHVSALLSERLRAAVDDPTLANVGGALGVEL